METLVTCSYKDGICRYCKSAGYDGRFCVKKAITFATACIRHVSEGGFDVSDEVYKERLSICETCSERQDEICIQCGCHLPLKARWATQECPLKKWPELDLTSLLPAKSRPKCCG